MLIRVTFLFDISNLLAHLIDSNITERKAIEEWLNYNLTRDAFLGTAIKRPGKVISNHSIMNNPVVNVEYYTIVRVLLHHSLLSIEGGYTDTLIQKNNHLTVIREYDKKHEQ